MISYAYENLFKQDSVAKTVSMTGSGLTISNGNLDGENFSIDEVLNSGRDLKFGECNAAKLSFSCGYYEHSMVGVLLTTKTTPSGGTAFQFGQYKVANDIPTADRKFRNVVAYDKLYDVLKFDVAGWYNSILPDENASISVKDFRDSFFTIFNITQKSIHLPNDTMTIKRTINPKILTGKSVLNALCELNACFGRMGRDGNFEYVYPDHPESGLFPRNTLYPANDLYPTKYGFESRKEYEDGTYISVDYEDYLTQVIDKLVILKSDDTVGVTIGSGNNVYTIKNNFLLFDKDATNLNIIGQRIYDIISGIWYRPCKIEAVGNPCLECGDGIRVRTTDGKDIDTIIWKRKIKGVQSLKDSITADGLKVRENDGNSVNDQISQIQGAIREVKADLIETGLLLAEEIRVERAKIDDLTAIAITTENLSAQTISADQITTGSLNASLITSGTLDASRITVSNLSASSINAGQMSVERLTDIYGGTAQSRWYEITYVSSGSLTDWVSVRNGANTDTVLVPTGLSLSSHRLYVLKGSPQT